MLEKTQPTVSVIIKAYNEQQHIAGAIESALTALRGIDGEVILADSASTDRTIAIAQSYPIRIVAPRQSSGPLLRRRRTIGLSVQPRQNLFA